MHPDPPAAPAAARPRALFAGVALLGLTLDVVSKVLVVDRLDPAEPVRLLGGLLTLQLIRNPGAAFSQGEGITWVFALAAVAVLVFVLVRLMPRVRHLGWAVALGLLVAGVGGNLIDRLFRSPGPLRGHVVDFLQLPHWPIFNVADMCITSAAVLIVLLALVGNVGLDGRRPDEKTARPDDEAARQDDEAARPDDEAPRPVGEA